MTNIRSIRPEELRSLPAGTRLIDVREHHEYYGPLGHLPDAELVPLGTLPQAAQGWLRESPIAVICQSGNRSAKACKLLAAEGFQHLINIDGGMRAVRENGGRNAS